MSYRRLKLVVLWPLRGSIGGRLVLPPQLIRGREGCPHYLSGVIELRQVVRKLAKGESDARTARRILAIANALDRISREDAAHAAGIDRQTLCDYVILLRNCNGISILASI
jgi:hypothetical protein